MKSALDTPFTKTDLLAISASLEDPTEWKGIVINKYKPHTWRLERLYDGVRTCLHMFDTCGPQDIFMHPHAWPARFLLLQGSYELKLGEIAGNPNYLRSVLSKGSFYEMNDPKLVHGILPLEPCFTIMQNGAPYTQPDPSCVTTVGKELPRMEAASVYAQIESFQYLIDDYLYNLD
jgi:hypothetical protein